MKKWLPWILVAIFVAWIVGAMMPVHETEGFQYSAFGKLPVLLNGRVQPFDSVARNALLDIHGTQTVRPSADSTDKTILSPMEWLLEAMAKPEEADKRRIFRLENQQLRALLNSSEGRLGQVSFQQIKPQWEQIAREAESIMDPKHDPKLRSGYEKDVAHLFNSVILYHRLKNSLQPFDTDDFQKELKVYSQSIGPGIAAMQKSEAKEAFDETDLKRMAAFFKRFQELAKYAYPLAVPPVRPAEAREAWSNVGNSLLESMRHGEIHPAVTYFAAMTAAYAQSRPSDFNRTVAEYRDWLTGKNLGPELKKGANEYFFNHLEPFYKAAVIYVAALLLGCAFWLNLSETVRRTAFKLLILAFIIHTTGLLFRMYLEGRPPVTNLYSSAIFIGWGICLLGLILERIFRVGIGIVAASIGGFVTLIIAHHLSLSGDTMEMLQAVLDTNLWLSTHVVCITTGYSATFAAGLLAILYVVRGFFTRSLTPELGKILSRMVYGIVCFATLFSFVGTILGGIWADQSWGRFWGWDPKENGALLIVLWNAIILHARWGGIVRERGLMALALFGNIVTSFSWFGVNMLGIGLHSYGFMDAAFKWLMLFISIQAALIIICLLPTRFWASFKNTPDSRPPAPPFRPPKPQPARS